MRYEIDSMFMLPYKGVLHLILLTLGLFIAYEFKWF
jgi:hypothetical protein